MEQLLLSKIQIYTKKISEILYNVDVMGLVPMGVPKDEYDKEAEMIASYLIGGLKQSLDNIVYDVFREQFGTGVDFNGNKVVFAFEYSPKFKIIADRIERDLIKW